MAFMTASIRWFTCCSCDCVHAVIFEGIEVRFPLRKALLKLQAILRGQLFRDAFDALPCVPDLTG
jgi:hypothetical protein